jgi:hypothetical protein
VQQEKIDVSYLFTVHMMIDEMIKIVVFAKTQAIYSTVETDECEKLNERRNFDLKLEMLSR